MSFLNPAFLYALGALSIPVVIHLFNFRRTRKVYYSSTQFLKNIKEASTSKLQLKHWLILASRLLFVFFLVMAFAQPFIPAREKNVNTDEVLIYLNNSYSMSNEVEADYRGIDAGMSFIQALTRLFPTGSNYRIYTNDLASYSNFYRNEDDLLDITTEIDLSGNIRSFQEIWSRMKTSVSGSVGGSIRQVFWIDDFQQTTTGVIETEDLDSTFNFNIFPVSFSSHSNIYVDSIYLSNPFILGSESVELTLIIKNSGPQEKSDVPLKVFVNNLQMTNATVDVPPLSQIEQRFDLGFNLQKLNIGRVSIEDYPITFDNDFYFTIDVGEKIHILEIKSGEEASPVEKVFANTDLFQFSSYQNSNIDYSQINKNDLLILTQLESIDASLITIIREFLADGGALMLIPALQPDLLSYQSMVSVRNLGLTDTVFRQELAPPDLSNPFYENVFEEVDGIIAMPQASRVLIWGTDQTALLKFRNGQPFLSRIEGNQNIFLLAGPLDDVHSGFQNHAIFVPVMYKVSMNSKKRERPLFYSISQQVIELGVDNLSSSKIIRMVNDENEFIPNQRITSGTAVLELPSDELKPGFYTLLLEDEEITTLAFNFDHRESDLRQLTMEQLEASFSGVSNVSLFKVTDEGSFVSSIREEFQGLHLWKVAILLALLFLLTEIALVRLL